MHLVRVCVAATLSATLGLAACSSSPDRPPAESSSERSAATPRPTAGAEPVACPRLGVYNDWSPDADLDSVRSFGALPQVSSSYYQPTDRIRVPEERARIRRGTSPNITITTKGTDTIEVLAAGPADPRYADVEAWLSRHLDDLAVLADIDRAVPVYVTLEHEFKVKSRTGQLTGLSADPEVYGRALDRFFRLVDERSPRLRTTYWIVGYDREFEGTVGEQLRTLPEVIAFDPYPNEPDETLPEIAAEDVEWIRSQPWYDGQELGIGEFGMPVEFGDEAVARFLTDVPDQLAGLGVSWAVLFNRERDFDTRIAARADGREFPLARAAFAASLKAARAC